MKEHSEEIIPIKRDQNFKETYNEILRRIRKLKIVELRAVGRAVGTAISLSEKIASENQINYIRFTTEEFVGKEDRKTILCSIRLKLNGELQPKQEKEQKIQYKEKSATKNQRATNKTNENKGGPIKYKEKSA